MQPAPWSQGLSHLGLELSSPGMGVGRSVGGLKPQNPLYCLATSSPDDSLAQDPRGKGPLPTSC